MFTRTAFYTEFIKEALHSNILNVKRLIFLITVTNHPAETLCNLQSNNFLASRLVTFGSSWKI